MGNAFSDLGRGLGYNQPETPQPVAGAPGPNTQHSMNTTPVEQDLSGSAPAPATPTLNLASGVGQILLFPGKTIVSQFVGTGDPLDTSHLPITILLSAAAWYAAYWWFFQRAASRPRSGD